jgi:hypothetical protein
MRDQYFGWRQALRMLEGFLSKSSTADADSVLECKRSETVSHPNALLFTLRARVLLAPPGRMIGGPGLTGYPRSVTLSWPFGSSKALCHDNTTGAVRIFAEAPGKLGRFMCGLASRRNVKALRPTMS